MPSAGTEEEIMTAIQSAQDPAMRAILMIQLKALRDLGGMIAGISARLDEFMADEKKIASLALNGHAENHGPDHDWIYQQKLQVEQINEERAWVQERMRSNCAARSNWVMAKIELESSASRKAEADKEEDRKQAKVAKWRIIERILWAALVAATVYLGGYMQ